jgi:hypothetical protein
MDLDAYRRSAETFLSEVEAEYYRHYAGLKEAYEIESIYARHGALFTRQAIETLRELGAAATPGGEGRRRLTMLLDFAVEGYLGEATKTVEAELARREAGLSLDLDDRRLGFRESSVVQANEPDPGAREAIERAHLELTERELGALYRELIDRQHESAAALGWDSYREMCADCKSIDLADLERETLAFTAATGASFREVVDPALRRTLGFGLDRLRRSDLPRFFRAPDEDRHFPADRLIPSFLETLRGLGIEATGQAGVNLDLEPRPHKSPRAFCAPVRVPGEVYLVLAPIGGRDDYAALLHEGGHAQHAAHVDADLPFEFRYLGDNGVSEAYAFLFDHLVEDPEWLERRLGVGDVPELISYARAQRLIHLRRYAAKLSYELELHGAGNGRTVDALAPRYAELLGAALQIQWPTQPFLADVDPGFYCTAYLRAWPLEAHLRAYLRERFGPAWFEEREAGDVLRSLWREGQRMAPDELLAQLTGERLEFAVVLEDLGIA